jgi:hypothetical protein
MVADGVVSESPQQFRQGFGLVVAVLENQSPVGFQSGAGIAGYGFQGIQSEFSAFQRQLGLEAHIPLSEMRILVGDIRGIADDEVENPVFGYLLEPVAQQEADIADPMAGGIALGGRDGRFAEIDRGYPGEGSFGGQGDGNDPAAGAEVQDLDGARFGKKIQCEFDQQFGLRAGDEDAGANLENPRPEFLFAGEISDRHAGCPPLDRMPEILRFLCGQQPFGPGSKVGTFPAERLSQQDLGVQAGGFAGGGEFVRGCLYRAAYGFGGGGTHPAELFLGHLGQQFSLVFAGQGLDHGVEVAFHDGFELVQG